ncbi:hypothetical protein [Abyssalbus ytuae]|uniref:Uncharacterized protein n=1 Tax=Abyssalbus ytuae TaxID=2926907 RepID=A0A9E6ZWP8_9FLAO|nr:hypothetical protein [Abyssalbus ytuae]UOB18196.1 hypothetical protein MQE35_02595 [Abyssalbus ytuae]
MKKILFVFISLFIFSCDDGEFNVEVLDFDDSAVNLCKDFTELDEYVFYKLSDDKTKALIIQLETNDDLLRDIGTVTFNLSAANKILYRIFDGDASSFFCNEVQPANPKVIEEWTASAGTIEIETVLAKDDNDGIDSEDEDLNNDGDLENDDSDQDGLPNYIDLDDDGDNVPTSQEGYDADNPENSRDTDGDGIFDYLDPDDDGDGVDTRLEVTDNNLDSPANNINNDIANYLNPEVADAYSGTETITNREHRYTNGYSNTIRIINGFQLQGNGQEIKYEVSGFDYGTYETTDTITHEF